MRTCRIFSSWSVFDVWCLQVTFENQTVEIFADDVDFDHFPLIYVSKIRKEHRSGLIELPESDAFKKLVGFKRVIFSFSQIHFAGEVDEERGNVVSLTEAKG